MRSREGVYPDFLILGAEQSGTTPLARSLRSHPRLFIPTRELQFFAYADGLPRYARMSHEGIVNDRGLYLSHFAGAPDDSTVGEKSVSYFHRDFYRRSIENLRVFHPAWETLKIIMVLSNPIERAFVHYKINCALHERLPFDEALKAWPERKREGWVPAYDYLGTGYYADPLVGYGMMFKETKIVLEEDLRDKPVETLSSLLSFLGVDGRTLPLPFETPNGVKNFWRRWKPLLRGGAPLPASMDEETRRGLKEIFRDDIRLVEKLSRRNLSHWL